MAHQGNATAVVVEHLSDRSAGAEPLVTVQHRGQASLQCDLCCLQRPVIRTGDQPIQPQTTRYQCLHHRLGAAASPRRQRPIGGISPLNPFDGDAVAQQHQLNQARVGHAEEEQTGLHPDDRPPG